MSNSKLVVDNQMTAWIQVSRFRFFCSRYFQTPTRFDRLFKVVKGQPNGELEYSIWCCWEILGHPTHVGSRRWVQSHFHIFFHFEYLNHNKKKTFFYLQSKKTLNVKLILGDVVKIWSIHQNRTRELSWPTCHATIMPSKAPSRFAISQYVVFRKDSCFNQSVFPAPFNHMQSKQSPPCLLTQIVQFSPRFMFYIWFSLPAPKTDPEAKKYEKCQHVNVAVNMITFPFHTLWILTKLFSSLPTFLLKNLLTKSI